jgi:AraC-like DNA-binding protein
VEAGVQDVEFASDDLDATEDFLNRIYTRLRMSGDGERSSSHVVRRWLGDINADRLTIDYNLAFDANPLERVCLCRTRSGHIVENTHGRRSEVFAPGDLTLFAPPELPFNGQLCETSYDLTMFDSQLLDRVATAAPGRDEEPVQLLAQRPVTKAAGRQLSSLIDYLHELIFTNEEARHSPLVIGTAEQHLAASVLQAFPSTALLEPTIEGHRDRIPVLLRRAIAFIDENAHRDIALADIAGAIYVTPRALQYMFRRHRDCTPMEYLRRVRLHYAHLDLVAGDRATTTVGQVAA